MKKVVSAIIFILVGAGIVWFANWSIKKSKAQQKWPTVNGTVISTKINETYTKKKREYTPSVTYGYTVNGTQYTSNRISFAVRQYQKRSKASSIVNRYRAGSQVVVHYNPLNPAEAVLKVGVNKIFYIIYAVGIILLIVGVIAFFRDSFKLVLGR